jgi:archaellin
MSVFLVIASTIVRPRLVRGAVLVAAFLLLGGRAARASETKTYPGSFCVPYHQIEEQYVSVANGQIQAVSSGTIVVCPIVKSVASDPVIEKITMNVAPVAGAGNISCDLWALGTSVTSTTSVNAVFPHANATASAGQSTLVFNNFGVKNPPPSPWDQFFTYEMFCTLRAGDRILDYQVREAGTNTDAFKIYPPSMCRPDTNTNDSNYIHRTPADSGGPGGYLQTVPPSDNQGDFSVVCPIITDHVTNNSKGLVKATIALGHPDNASQSISCTLYETLSFGPLDSNKVTFAGVQGSEFPTQTFDFKLTKGAKGARYHITCLAPAAGDAKILGYKIQEDKQ